MEKSLQKVKFEKDFTQLSKDPEVQKILEDNFHLYLLKTPEEQQRLREQNDSGNFKGKIHHKIK